MKCFRTFLKRQQASSTPSLQSLALLLSMSLFGQSAALAAAPKQATTVVAPSLTDGERPFHTTHVKINPTLAQQKPLAAADYAGVSIEDEVLIAAYDDQWAAAFNLSDMKPRWWLATNGGLTAPTGVFGSWAVLASRDGSLRKVNLLTGAVLWTANLDSFATRSLKKEGANLLVMTATQSLYNVDFETGQVRWIFDAGAPDGIHIRTAAPPVIHGQTAYVGLASGEVVAVALDNGRLIWRHNPSFTSARFHDVIDLIVLDRRLILTRYDGVIASVDLENPKTVIAGWEEPRLINSITATAYRQGKLYVGTTNGYLYAFNARNSKEIWHTHVGESLSSITAGETQLYTAATNGRLTTLDASNGSLVWHDHLRSTVVTPPVYIGKDLFFLTGHKVLYGFKVL